MYKLFVLLNACTVISSTHIDTIPQSLVKRILTGRIKTLELDSFKKSYQPTTKHTPTTVDIVIDGNGNDRHSLPHYDTPKQLPPQRSIYDTSNHHTASSRPHSSLGRPSPNSQRIQQKQAHIENQLQSQRSNNSPKDFNGFRPIFLKAAKVAYNQGVTPSPNSLNLLVKEKTTRPTKDDMLTLMDQIDQIDANGQSTTTYQPTKAPYIQPLAQNKNQPKLPSSPIQQINYNSPISIIDLLPDEYQKYLELSELSNFFTSDQVEAIIKFVMLVNKKSLDHMDDFIEKQTQSNNNFEKSSVELDQKNKKFTNHNRKNE